MLHNILTGILLLSVLLTSNCFGKFTLLQKVHGINAQINVGEGKVNGAFKSLFMILMAVVQLYTGAVILDVAFLNLVEFWTEKNPLGNESSKAETEILEDGAKLSKVNSGNELTLSITKNSHSFTFIALKNEPGKLFTKKNDKLEEIKIESMPFGSLLLVSVDGKNQILKREDLERIASF